MERKIGIYLLTLLTVLSVVSLGSASAQVKRAVARESVDAPALPNALDLELARIGSGVPPAVLHPEAVLYDNGPLVNHPGGGAGGADASALQTALGNSTYGFGHSPNAPGYRVADDFTVPAGGWTITTITFYAYQTGSTTTSTINHVNLRIWDGPPGASGSNVVFGDTTTNRLAGSSFTNIYRVLDTNLLDSTRPIMADVVTVNQVLGPGTYWLDWQTGGTLSSGPWAPPVTLTGQTQKPGANGLQWDGSTWNPALDTGNNTQQDFPFVIEGTAGGGSVPNINVSPSSLSSTQLPNTTTTQTLTVGNTGTVDLNWQIAEDPNPNCASPADVPWLSVSSASGTNAGGTNTAVTVTFNSTGLLGGTYNASLCVTSNDPDPGPGPGTNLVIVPVSMTVTGASCTPPLLEDGFESGPGSWTADGTPAWSIVNTAANSGSYSFFAPNAGSISDTRLVSPPFTIPGAATLAALEFWHRVRTETTYDGGVLEVTTDGGSSWTDLSSNITVGGYNGVISSAFSNPLAGRPAWTGSIPAGAGFARVVVNLLPLAGQTVQIRWRLGSDTSVGATGWWVDDVVAWACPSGGGGDPNIDVSPLSLSETHATPPQTTTRTLTVTNTGTANLDWQIAEDPNPNCVNPADVPWLSVNPTSASSVPAGSSAVTVTFDSTGLAAGAYGANLCVTSNDPNPGPGNGTELVVVPVSLTVSGPAMHTVTSSVGTPSGTIAPPSQQVTDGSTAAFTLTPAAGYEIDGVTGTCPAGSLAGNVYTTGAITADCQVVANFRPESGPAPSVLEIPTLGPAGGALLGLLLAGLGLGTLRRRRA